MRLRSIRVHGFKSFPDPTIVEFHDGITAIVGPNGCGKSNIGDAVRWVLGEQRPSALRGGKMEEVIFQGSLSRRPVNRSSVSMIVTNEDGLLPVAYREIEIGRTVYRDGGSDYSINRSICRLRDIVDLFRDTGLGANAYSVIENRMIDAILSDRAEERRKLFEEASGIGKYKDRRKAALRGLSHAENDLARLEDVIAEVETKVRSLARQKGKAERYKALRARRLAVEVAVARSELVDLRMRLEDLDRSLEGDRRTGRGIVAQLRTAEATCEKLRLEEVSAEHSRGEAVRRLEGVREELVAWERDLAVAQERRRSAERRLDQVTRDHTAWATRLEEVSAESESLEAGRERHERELRRLRTEASQQAAESAIVKARLQEARERAEETEHRERELVREGAQLKGDAEGAENRAAELARRISNIELELSDATNVLTGLEAQGDLFVARLGSLESAVRTSRGRLKQAHEALKVRWRSLDEARQGELSAARAVQGMEAEIAALEALGLRQEGVDGVTREALALGDRDVVGSLLEFIEAPADVAAVVEAYLGFLGQALVVRDGAAADRILRWFREEWTGGGGLVLLPLDRVPKASGGSLMESVKARGSGAPWVEALLGEVDLVHTQDSADPAPGRPQVSMAGTVTDPRGFIRVGRPLGASGMLERRARVEELRRELENAREHSARCGRDLADTEAAAEEADQILADARASFLKAEDELREASAEMAAQADRHTRLDTHVGECTRRLEEAKAARTKAKGRAQAAAKQREIVLDREEVVRTERARARRVLAGVQEEWEETRGEESRLSVALVRREGATRRVEERLDDLAREATSGRDRLRELEEEERTLTEDLAAARQSLHEGAAAVEQLFGESEKAQEVLEERRAALNKVAEALDSAEEAVRQARRAERQAVEHRHKLELERQQVARDIALIQERLEVEWGRRLDRLLEEAESVDGEPEALREELRELVTKLDRVGPVNMLAAEEHAEESRRLAFLDGQREDLVAARDDLRTAIRQINETAVEVFGGTFEKIRENFRSTFRRLFEGGEADIWLDDPDDPLESAIEVHASPRGKKTRSIDLLSGGERALTALSLLFGIYLVKPSPLCVLDEVDAPLDESNIGRFVRLLQELKKQTQFVLITHNPRSIEAADWIYGVTMEEPGVSTVVGVRLQDALRSDGSAPGAVA